MVVPVRVVNCISKYTISSLLADNESQKPDSSSGADGIGDQPTIITTSLAAKSYAVLIECIWHVTLMR